MYVDLEGGNKVARDLREHLEPLLMVSARGTA